MLSAIAAMTDAPDVVHVVANGVRGDSRVLKCAQAAIAAGRTSLIVGIVAQATFECFEIEGIPVILVPRKPRAGLAEQGPRRDTLEAWSRRERDLSRVRATNARKAGRIGESVKGTLRAILPRTGEPSWSARRKRILDSNLAFAEILDALTPTTVHVHDSLPLPAACVYSARQALRHQAPVKVIYDSHECLPELVKSYPTSPYYVSLSRIEDRYIHDASCVITVSPAIASLLKSVHGLAALPGVVTNAPSSVRTSAGVNLRRQVGLDARTPLAVYSGFIAPERGIGTVVSAMARVPELHLALVVNRESEELRSVLSLAVDLGVAERVHVAPYVPPAQITEYLSSATIGIIPLHAGAHLDLSLPSKFREYLHAGLALVVSNNRTMAAEVEATGVGRVFESGNVHDLVTQLDTVLCDPSAFAGKITAELLAEHSWETQVEVLLRLYAPDQGCPQRGSQDAVAVQVSRIVNRIELAD